MTVRFTRPITEQYGYADQWVQEELGAAGKPGFDG